MRDEREKSDYLKVKDRDRRVADFHSLRHGFITYLVTANVPPKVAQTLARHSTITFTMDRYAHLGVGDLVEGLKKLSAILLRTENAKSVRDIQYSAATPQPTLILPQNHDNCRMNGSASRRNPVRWISQKVC